MKIEGKPTKPAMLRHPDDDSIARFRERLKEYKSEVKNFNQMHNTDIKVVVKALVEKSVWRQISRRYLKTEHKTKKREEPNHIQVENYITRKGAYSNTGRDKPFIRDPIQTDVTKNCVGRRHKKRWSSE